MPMVHMKCDTIGRYLSPSDDSRFVMLEPTGFSVRKDAQMNSTLFLSRLIIDPRSRAVRRDLGDCHDLHRTIMAAFPQAQANDAGARAQFDVLFRVDTDGRSGKVMLLVQSR